MNEKQTWRSLLKSILQNAQEKQRLAAELGVTNVTLGRWVDHISNPRPQSLRQLAKSLPEQRVLIQMLIEEEFPGTFSGSPGEISDEVPEDIPHALYISVLHTHATIGGRQRFWSITDQVLQDAVRQLDPHQEGISVTLATLVPPSTGQKVRSMREVAGRGNHPWKHMLERQYTFLGVESLAGFAVSESRQLSVQDKSDRANRYPGQWVDWEESSTACPLKKEGMIGGCLIASSTQPGYFTPLREKLVQEYAELIVLALNQHDFFSDDQVQLVLMPSQNEQEAYVAKTDIRKRLTDVVQQASQKKQAIHVSQAEIIVAQQLEEELVRLTSEADSTVNRA